MSKLKINPVFVLLLLGACFLAFASIVNLEAGPAKFASKTKNREVNIDPLLKEQVFADATELLGMVRAAKIETLLEIRNELKIKNDPQRAERALSKAGCPTLDALGDLGFPLSYLLLSLEKDAVGFTANGVKNLSQRMLSKKSELEDVSIQDLYREWKSTLPRELRMSNNESMDFKSLLRNPWVD
ncbi:hypothetical protein GW915_03080 [bacterium]|nr:hypothetical protein [bacterium]